MQSKIIMNSITDLFKTCFVNLPDREEERHDKSERSRQPEHNDEHHNDEHHNDEHHNDEHHAQMYRS